MSTLTLDEKTDAAASHARLAAAESHYYDEAQPFFPLGFSVGYRNPGHWDILARETPGRASAWRHAHPEGSATGTDGEVNRAFRIRGEPGNVLVYDERWNPHRDPQAPPTRFASVTGAMVYVVEELMREPA